MTPLVRRLIGYIAIAACAVILLFLCLYRTDVAIEEVSYHPPQNDRIWKMDIYHPPGWRWTRHKTILFVHGGGWVTGDKADFSDKAIDCARHGYICFSVNYRLATPTTNAYPAQIDDVQLAVRWIRDHAFIYRADTERIAAVGESAGGHLVAMLGTTDTRNPEYALLNQYHSRVDCVIDLEGPTDLTAPFPDTPQIPMQKWVNDFLGGAAANRPDVARAASPIFLINRSTAQFLIFHGDVDPVVPVDQSRRFVQALQANHVPVTYVEFPTEGHVISGATNCRKLQELSYQFVNSCL